MGGPGIACGEKGAFAGGRGGGGDVLGGVGALKWREVCTDL